MAMATGSKRRSSRQMATRKRSRYVDPETDDELLTPSDDDSESDTRSYIDHSPRSLKRRSLPRDRGSKTPRKGTVKSGTRQSGISRQSKGKGKGKGKKKFVVVGRPRRARGEHVKDVDTGLFKGPSDGVIPPWTTLPPDVLKDIFVFGSQPLTAANISWLVNAARTCRKFMAPALEALYYWPAIWSPAHLHSLLGLLQQRDGRLIIYNTKIKRLDIDVRRLAYTAHNKSLFNLGDLLAELPRLQHLEIVHPVDEPPYREMKLQAWTYQPTIFESLATSQIRLHAWRWTKDMLKNKSDIYAFMTSIHKTLPFERLTEIVLCGFDDTGSLGPSDGDESAPSHNIWTTISTLKSIKDITFISCSVAREEALARLPPTLERLELSNCHEVNSDVLAHYLKAGGSRLKELVLHHNPALDLAFLPALKLHCPRLEELQMSLNFYSELHVTNDAEPLYDELLQADEIPTWPATMRVIDIQHMQKWDSAGATNLFQSLVDHAQDLPDLRFIVLHSHINIPWRDRTGFRERWIDKLEKVFKRRDPAPMPHNGSKRQFMLWQQLKDKPSTSVDAGYRMAKVEPMEVDEDEDEDDMPLRRRSQRVAAVLASPSAATLADDSSSDGDSTGSELFVQGRCDVVDIRIDNQRPRENQFTEQDFLDTEVSGDEDWNESADEAVEDGYAW